MNGDGLELGTEDHDKVGEQFLVGLGFPPAVTRFVRGHVQAKRYLVHKRPQYHSSLSAASKVGEMLVKLIDGLSENSDFYIDNYEVSALISGKLCKTFPKFCLQATLVCQGGPMTAVEADQFEADPNFPAMLEMRGWDERAKDASIPPVENEKFQNKIRAILNQHK